MNAHQLDAKGVVINTIVVNSLEFMPGLVDAAIGGSIGDRIIGGKLVPRPTAAAVVPQSVPMLDARLTMIAAGWMPGVKAYLAALPGIEGEQAREYFEYALTMRRDHPLTQSIPAALGKTDADIDALFIAAAALNA